MQEKKYQKNRRVYSQMKSRVQHFLCAREKLQRNNAKRQVSFFPLYLEMTLTYGGFSCLSIKHTDTDREREEKYKECKKETPLHYFQFNSSHTLSHIYIPLYRRLSFTSSHSNRASDLTVTFAFGWNHSSH